MARVGVCSRKSLWIFALLCGLMTSSISQAVYPVDWEDDQLSHDRARRALERGEILPFTAVLQILRSKVRGDIVAIEYEYEFERWVYEFKIIDAQGRLRKIHIDAAVGTFIEDNHH